MKKRIILGIILLCFVFSLFFFRQTMITGSSSKMKKGGYVIDAELATEATTNTISLCQDDFQEIAIFFGDTDQDTSHIGETAEDIPFQTDAQYITTETDSEKVSLPVDSGKYIPSGEYIQPSSPVVPAEETESTVTWQEPMVIHHEAEYITIHHDESIEQIMVVDKDAYDEMVLIHSAYSQAFL